MLLMFLPENEEYTVFLPFKFRIDSKAAKQRREMNMVNHLSWGRLVFVFPLFFSALLVVAQERHEKLMKRLWEKSGPWGLRIRRS